MNKNTNSISEILITWYLENHRKLPWRETSDPFRIWLSEVILQQTRVAQGLAYYNRFCDRFKDVASLAAAEEDEILKLWQGLGYYSRARSLHTAAKQIVERFNGQFPQRYEEVLSLKGIGPYTAAAICSIAFGLPHATVDGNVYRVLSRLFNVDLPIDSSAGQRYFAELAENLLDRNNPGLHNQAMMEFGALLCTPKSPQCEVCPLENKCLAHSNHTVNKRPKKEGKTATRSRYFNYLHIENNGEIILCQRTGNDIWRGLYEFPLIETEGLIELEELLQHESLEWLKYAGQFSVLQEVVMPPHQLSHQTIHTRFLRLEIENRTFPIQTNCKWISKGNIHEFAVSRLMERYLLRAF